MASEQSTRARSKGVARALSVIDLGVKACGAYQRPDLASRLHQARARLADPAFHVLVVGEFKKGKSTLVNALLNAPVCPVDDDIATAVPTLVRYQDDPGAAVVLEPPPAEGDEERPEPERHPIPLGQVRSHVTELAGGGEEGRRVQAVEIGIPRRLLASGIVLVDTPGVGGLGSAHTATTIGALPWADAVVFVTDASQEFSGPELEFIQTARSMCPHLYCVLTKTDFYPSWRKVRDLDLEHLRRAGIDMALQPVSSTLRRAAVESNDKDLNAESGFTELIGFLSQDIAANAETLAVRAAMGEVVAVSDQLDHQFQAEHEVLSDPQAAASTMERLEEAKAGAEQLKSQLARWQTTLNDGLQDLQADVDFDLRQRIRVLTRQSDDAIDVSDPIKTWDEFEPWLYRRVAEDVTNNHRYLQIQSQELAERVAEHFELGQGEVVLELEIANPTDAMQRVGVDASTELKKLNPAMQMLSGVRGGYYGSLMFTALGGMAGLALGPVAVGAGLILGRKSLKDEKERALLQRRQQAKNAVRKYTDEVVFHVGTDSRYALRRIQRQLRDHYSTRAEELHKSAADALQSAQKGAQHDEASRKKRLADVDSERARIAGLRTKALELAPTAAPTGGGEGAGADR